jgi:uncharacterized protein YodC (DUF2158 family)
MSKSMLRCLIFEQFEINKDKFHEDKLLVITISILDMYGL